MDPPEALTAANPVVDEVGQLCQGLFLTFLEEFKEDNEIKYRKLAMVLLKPVHTALVVSFADVEKHNQNLATTIIEEYYRVNPFIKKALLSYVSSLTDDTSKKSNLQRKPLFVSFVDVPTTQKIRELSTTSIGTLISISGQVMRTHPVHPELLFGAFMCMECHTIIKNVEQEFKYTLPTTCRNPVCENRRNFMLDTDLSVFADFQKIHIQELQSELPRGCIPRTIDIILREENVDTVQPGDRYNFTGNLIVVPDVGVLSFPGAKVELTTKTKQLGEGHMQGVKGLKALGVRELQYKTAFLACSVQSITKRSGAELNLENMTAENVRKILTEQEWEKMYSMSRDPNLYNNLMTSLFPSIHGYNEVKRGILLMLFGGVAKTTIENTTLRGDINVCLVGDPSTAKSQLLKLVSEIVPRGVFTSGKTSTAAGLTAAVVKDQESSDFVIEAGALMLADNGVCCIDDFDMMDLYNQVAIHEAMEQQTISIAKAGIRTTLKARTSVLAAVNPKRGRYDRSRSLQQNIELSAPIMSRFDLFFILIDEAIESVDCAIARTIIDLHCNKAGAFSRVYTQQELQLYISFARTFQPMITEEAGKLLVKQYCALRQRDAEGGRGTSRITVRQLESMVRLAEAMAKMYCSDRVTEEHAREACRLLNQSIIRVEEPEINLGDDELQPNSRMNVEELPIEDLDEEEEDLTTKKVMLSFEEYRKLTNTLIVHVREVETRTETSGKDTDALRKSAIVSWYLQQLVNRDQIESQEQLLEKKQLIEKVIERLMFHDNILLPLTDSKVRSAPGSSKQEDQEYDPVLVVHPNYVVDA